jgi:hypothetical protein
MLICSRLLHATGSGSSQTCSVQHVPLTTQSVGCQPLASLSFSKCALCTCRRVNLHNDPVAQQFGLQLAQQPPKLMEVHGRLLPAPRLGFGVDNNQEKHMDPGQRGEWNLMNIKWVALWTRQLSCADCQAFAHWQVTHTYKWCRGVVRDHKHLMSACSIPYLSSV